jgi:hypothetical protein
MSSRSEGAAETANPPQWAVAAVEANSGWRQAPVALAGGPDAGASTAMHLFAPPSLRQTAPSGGGSTDKALLQGSASYLPTRPASNQVLPQCRTTPGRACLPAGRGACAGWPTGPA